MKIEAEWKDVATQPPTVCKPVLGYSSEWECADFNVEGMRECFLIDDGPWLSAKWDNDQDCWQVDDTTKPTLWLDPMTISPVALASALGPKWTCFHCGETFTTPGTAREHFGRTEASQPGCVIKVELGGERGLLTALRDAEDELTRYRDEDGDLQRALAAMQSRHAPALMAAEEAGYARGLRDAARAEKQTITG